MAVSPRNACAPEQGMMQQVADAYADILHKAISPPQML
jgi:hypothetical protein